MCWFRSSWSVRWADGECSRRLCVSQPVLLCWNGIMEARRSIETATGLLTTAKTYSHLHWSMSFACVCLKPEEYTMKPEVGWNSPTPPRNPQDEVNLETKELDTLKAVESVYCTVKTYLVDPNCACEQRQSLLLTETLAFSPGWV